MAQKFSTAMTKLSLLGHSQNQLTDCTEIIVCLQALSWSSV